MSPCSLQHDRMLAYPLLSPPPPPCSSSWRLFPRQQQPANHCLGLRPFHIRAGLRLSKLLWWPPQPSCNSSNVRHRQGLSPASYHIYPCPNGRRNAGLGSDPRHRPNRFQRCSWGCEPTQRLGGKGKRIRSRSAAHGNLCIRRVCSSRPRPRPKHGTSTSASSLCDRHCSVSGALRNGPDRWLQHQSGTVFWHSSCVWCLD